MTPEEFTKASEKLGFEFPMHCAKWVGRDIRTGQRYAVGDQPVPRAIAMLLGLMLELKLSPEQVENLTKKYIK